MTIAFNLALILCAFLALAWSADRFVAAAGGLALRLGMPMVLVGLVIVGFGTSAPEMLVSALAAYADNTGLAIGNALGSNIANIALILGIAALVTPVLATLRSVRTELLTLLVVTLGIVPLLLNGQLGRLDGVLLLTTLVGILIWFTMRARRGELNVTDAVPNPGPVGRTILWLVISLCILLVSAQILVVAAANLARMAGVSDLVIGLSIVALGTSLPELATSIAAVRQRQFALVIGNILGSNLFNLLAVLGLAVAIRPTELGLIQLLRDYGVMTALTVILWLLLLTRQGIGRLSGLCLVMAYLLYQAILFALPHT